jgi:hypothetical protein
VTELIDGPVREKVDLPALPRHRDDDRDPIVADALEVVVNGSVPKPGREAGDVRYSTAHPVNG